VSLRRKRRVSGAVRRGRVGERVYKAEWVDPFPGILGTKVEKKVMAELVYRQIPFYFQHNVEKLPLMSGVQNWRVDFYIPEGKIIIEVNGYYWHSKEDAIAKDSFRYAMLTNAGYRVVAWWDYEIDTKLWDLFAADPVLSAPTVFGPPLQMENFIDDGKAIRIINARRMKRVGVTTRRTRRRASYVNRRRR
jgi:G:T-mismatch repair DNA endonuclease (very short patch repair protein)